MPEGNFMSGGAPQRGGGGAVERDGELSNHSDDPDLQWAIHESLAADANEEFLAGTRSSTRTSSIHHDADVEGPEAAGHGGGSASPSVAVSRGSPRPKNRSCKISAEIARTISLAKPAEWSTEQRNRSATTSAVAKQYGITAKAVRDIWNGRTWAWVTRQSRQPAGDAPQNAGTGSAQMRAGIVGSAR